MTDKLALEKAIDFIESLTRDPLLLPDDIEMTLDDVQAHARIELASIRKVLAASPQEQMTGTDAPYPTIPVSEIDNIRNALPGVTPGPWSYTTGDLVRVKAGDVCVAGVHRIGRQDEPAHSNARYLAAVNPEAITAILSYCDALSGPTGSGPAPQEHLEGRFRAALEQIVALRGYQGEDMGRVAGYGVAASIAEDALRLATPSPQMTGWPIDTDDQVEALARECDFDNRKYMTPADYSIWCERMRKFARLAARHLAGWQPIATAPTDGRDLIMTSTDWNGDILVGSFAFGKWRENPSPEGCSFTPTHWMPIPPMPGTTEGQPDA
ncbi:hypothetical protein [Neorhizobium sp. NCHU2750]|uniref:hypothetical protein n=1 Tax=Neorhizobium sp. NCHU2750 TaxID=1825976 RepID=UPI000E70B0E6|nr:hypothetical protein NCHU2750_05910 [Neorhizobium sp. NCHU2750]